MISYLKLLEFDGLYKNDPDAYSVLGHGETLVSNNQASEYIQALFYESANNISFVSHCDCGRLSGNFYKGAICKHCKTKVQNNFANELKFTAWLSIPEEMPPVLHPIAYKIFSKWLGSFTGGAKKLDVLLDVDVELPDPVNQVMGTGFSYFYKNFDDIMRYFINYKPLLRTYAQKQKTEYIKAFIKKYRPIMFVRNLPVLDNSLHLLTKTGPMRYSDTSSAKILKSLITLSNMKHSIANKPIGKTYVDQNMKVFYDSYIGYVDSIREDKLLGKKGFIRKFILGSRYHCSFRAVIVPIVDFHDADELHWPWRLGVTELKLEIHNLLIHRYGHSIKNAQARYERAQAMYDPIIDEILKTLIAECPYKGLPTLLGRNPTLRHGAIQLLFVTKIKTSVDDNVIGMSPLVLSAPNARILAFITEM